MSLCRGLELILATSAHGYGVCDFFSCMKLTRKAGFKADKAVYQCFNIKYYLKQQGSYTQTQIAQDKFELYQKEQ